MWQTEFTIKGITPMKQNRITERVIQEISGIGVVKLTQEQVINEWRDKAYKDKAGYYIPANQMQGCLIKGLCGPVPIKCNRIKFTMQKAKGIVFIQNNGYLQKGTEPTNDIQALSTKLGLVILSRPIFKEGWEATFRISIAQDWVSLQAIKDGIIQAGQCHGVGSNRPMFGRFILKDIKSID